MATIMDDIRKIPPVTRFLCGALVTITLSIKLDAVSFWSVVFTGKRVLKTGQVSSPLVWAEALHDVYIHVSLFSLDLYG